MFSMVGDYSQWSCYIHCFLADGKSASVYKPPCIDLLSKISGDASEMDVHQEMLKPAEERGTDEILGIYLAVDFNF